jgi:hypothetical protein
MLVHLGSSLAGDRSSHRYVKAVAASNMPGSKTLSAGSDMEIWVGNTAAHHD